MAQTTQDYLSIGKQTRLDLALSLDIHRSNAGAHIFKTLYGLKKSQDPKQALAEQMATTQFQLNQDTNPFFRKFVNEKLKNKKRIANHIADLTYIMLWDILSETQPTIKDLTEKGELPDSYVIDKKEGRRLINGYYDYMHYHPYKWSPQMEKLADDPKNFVFSFRGPRLKRRLPDKKDSLKPIGTPLTEREAFNTEIRIEDYADPYYIERLFSYRKKVLWMLETIGKKTTIRKEYEWVKDQLIYNDYALTIFFKNAATEVERRWFDYSLSPATKIEIIYGHWGGYYTEAEIVNTISSYKRLCEDIENKEYQHYKPLIKKVKENCLEEITLAGVYFANRGDTNISRWLFSNLLSNGFKLEDHDRAVVEHNLAIFQMLCGESQLASKNFESSLTCWIIEKRSLLEDIDRWNFSLAFDRTSKDITSTIQKHSLINQLVKRCSSVELKLFLIRQFADVAELFGDQFTSKLWLQRGLQESVMLDDFGDLALYFEGRLGSPGILGSTEKDREKALSQAQTMREKYCEILGATENYIIVIDRKFYLLREELIGCKELSLK